MDNEDRSENAKSRIVNIKVDLSKSSEVGFNEGILKTLKLYESQERMYSASQALQKLNSITKLSAFQELIDKSQGFHSVLRPILERQNILSQINNLAYLNFSALDSINRFSESSFKTFGEVKINSILIDSILSGITKNNFGALLENESIRTKIYKSTKKLFDYYPTLCEEVFSLERLAKNDKILLLSSQEIYLSSSLIESISDIKLNDEELVLRKEKNEEIDKSNTDELSILLPALAQNLVRRWIGAKESLESNNPDKFSHISVSLRELLREILFLLAPDEEVKKWNSDFNNQELYYYERSDTKKANPILTRNARFKYITRNIFNDPLNQFLKLDLESYLELIKILNKGTHIGDSNSNDLTLRILMLKTESLLKLFLTAVGLR